MADAGGRSSAGYASGRNLAANPERKASIAGAPELIIEVCASSQEHDFGPKLALYQRAGVREYITVSHTPAEVIWRKLASGRYTPPAPEADGTLGSKVFPGLWLDPRALLAGDSARVLDRLRAGLESQEHTLFAAGLRT